MLMMQGSTGALLGDACRGLVVLQGAVLVSLGSACRGVLGWAGGSAMQEQGSACRGVLGLVVLQGEVLCRSRAVHVGQFWYYWAVHAGH